MFYKTWQRMTRCGYCRKKHRYLETRCVEVAQQLRIDGEPLKLYASLCPDCYRRHVLGYKPKRTKPHAFLQKLPPMAETKPPAAEGYTRLERRFADRGWKVITKRSNAG